MAAVPTLYFGLEPGGADQGRFYDLFLLALCVWREARGEPLEAKTGVAWTVKNRAANPSWWGGPSYSSVILRAFQFSSFNHNDANATKWPVETDTSWMASLEVAALVFSGNSSDPTGGATHYYSGKQEPAWAGDGSMRETCTIGAFKFYRRAS
jgi:cell wall hydrolase